MNEIITAIRESLGLTKAEFAAALDCSPAMVTLMEQGKREPGPEITARLWELAADKPLRQLLADAILEAAGVPVEYVGKESE